MNRYMAYCTSHTGHPRASMTSVAQCGLIFSKAFAMSINRAALGPSPSRSCWIERTAFWGSRKLFSIDCEGCRCGEQCATTSAESAPSSIRCDVLGMPSGRK